MTNLELAFENELKRQLQEAKQKCRYNPTRFLQMLAEHGGVGTVNRLLTNHEFSDGFTRLYMEQRLDLTMEAAVIKPEFSSLFSAEQIELCKNKLAACGYYA